MIFVGGCSAKGLAEEESRCLAYKNTIEENIQYENSIVDKPTPSHDWIYQLKEVFFSKTLNSCIYVEDRGLYDGPVNAATDYVVKDFYNNKELKSFSIRTSREFTGELVEFEKYIKEIKGEK